MSEPASVPSRFAREARLVLVAVGLVAATAVPVVAALIVAGPTAARALYLGAVLATTVVLALPRREQWLAAAWISVVAAVGAVVGPRPWSLLIAVVACCLAQATFLRMDARALAVAPAILVFHAATAPAGSVWTVGTATLIGAAFVIGGAALARIRPHPQPLAWSRSILHAVLLAAGCAALLSISTALDMDRAHWGLLAFCLAFVPGPGTVRFALRYAAATAAGSAVAVTLGSLAPSWLVIALICAGAVLVVASTLSHRLSIAVAGIAGTVILVGTLSPGVPALTLGLERSLSALLAVGVGLGLLLVTEPLERLVTPLLAPDPRPADSNPEGPPPWIR